MRDLDDFLPLVMPNAPNAPEPTVFRCLRDAAIRFCERTLLWRETDSIVTLGLAEEPVSAPPDGVLHRIAECSIDGRPLDPISIDDLAHERPNWRSDPVGSGGARWYVSPDWGTVQAVPRSAGTLTVEYIAKPAANALTLPDFLFDHFGQALADGASGAVLLTPNASFSNPQLGSALLQRFEQTITSLTGAGRRGQTRAPTRTRGRYL